MKKTLMVIMMALLAVSVAFAAGPTVPVEGPIGNNQKTLKANLELTNANFAGYSMGFSSSVPEEGAKNDLAVSNVEEIDSVEITYDSNGNATSKTGVNFYYKVRTATKVTIALKADRLKTAGPENVKTLNYKINGSGLAASPVVVNGDTVDVITPVAITNDYAFATSGLSFVVENLTANDIGKYSATLTLSVTAG